MSNFQKSEFQAVSSASTSQNAAQSISQIDNPQTCVKKSTAVRPKLEYIEFFEKQTRAACNVAQVYSFLVFRSQRNKPGDASARLEVIREGGRWGKRAFWYLHTPEDIARECGKTVDKVESALKILKRLKLIEARAGRHPINGEVVRYRGKTVTHIRLGVCQRGNGLDCWPTVDQISQMRIIPGMAEAVLISSAEAVLLLPDTSVKTEDALEVKPNESSPGKSTPGDTSNSPLKSGKDTPTSKSKATPTPPVAPPPSLAPVTYKQNVKAAMMKKAGYSKNVNPVLPAGESLTSVCPNNDRLAAGHDMQYLLNLCYAGQFIGDWKALPDGHAGALVTMAELLATYRVTNSLESVLGLFSASPTNQISGGLTGWVVLRYATGDYTDCHPNLPSLANRVRRFLKFIADRAPGYKTLEFRVIANHMYFDTDSNGHPKKWEGPALSVLLRTDDGVIELRTEWNTLVEQPQPNQELQWL